MRKNAKASRDENIVTTNGNTVSRLEIDLTERSEKKAAKIYESNFDKIIDQLAPLKKEDPVEEEDEKKVKSFNERVLDTCVRRTTLEKVMRNTLKAKFDDTLKAEAAVVEARHKKKYDTALEDVLVMQVKKPNSLTF